MSEISDRYRRVAGAFTERVMAVPDSAWDNPTQCEGWVARDVVRHLIEWMGGLFFGAAGVPLPEGPSVDDDPVGAWLAFDAAVGTALDDPAIAATEFDSPAGHLTFEQGVDMLGTTDVLMHTWDLARATGLDDTLDPDEVHSAYTGMLPLDEMLRSSGHYGPKTEVPDDAPEQDKLMAFIGRQP
jgi:uncharacterized protein (TIGR03086 family)